MLFELFQDLQNFSGFSQMLNVGTIKNAYGGQRGRLDEIRASHYCGTNIKITSCESPVKCCETLVAICRVHLCEVYPMQDCQCHDTLSSSDSSMKHRFIKLIQIIQSRDVSFCEHGEGLAVVSANGIKQTVRTWVKFYIIIIIGSFLVHA
eukprot:gnl/TRDRNA2_/TRDRNA2_214515_c0_seq1.p2 gnl/TRDRNA2_/TRDRNA2_214515_c0~~gnl/TRDRNA2_/TRDRNA2_214515_c0_seq1.p2  ORF type:complete len:150 (+),score=14.59 gnl/TRDRNA2_/TRDRNA2_214515_c0_seq1:146-595(+)